MTTPRYDSGRGLFGGSGMKVEEAFRFADHYFNFMCGYRTRLEEEVELHFVILDEHDGQIQTCFVPPPDDNDSWQTMEKSDVRDAIICCVATIRPEYLITATEAWIVAPATDAEFAAVMAYKRSCPNSPLSEYPGAKEILNLMLEIY